jgi:hypothetical protein
MPSPQNVLLFMVCSNERTGKYPFDIQHRKVIPYKTEAQSDFSALSDSIIERLRAVAERGQALEQIAESEPVAPVSGLSSIELTTLAVAASAALPGAGFSLWSLQSDGEKAGLSKIGISLAIKRLMQKKLLEEMWVEKYGNEPYKGATISDQGWSWIDANEEKFLLRRVTRKTEPSEITDDDIPF